MTNALTKLIVGGLVLIVTVGYLIYLAIAAGGSYYLAVDAYTSSDEHRDARVRLHGLVGAEGLIRGQNGEKARFVLHGETSKITVRYGGIVPDLFEPGGEVVVAGRMGSGGVFEATDLMTKCASKYDEMKDKGKKRP